MAAPRGRGRPAVGERVHVRLPEDLIARLDGMAAEADLPRAALIRLLLEKAVDSTERPLTAP